MLERNIKKSNIIFRIAQERKNAWMKVCKKRNISLTDLITSAVEKRITTGERIEILKFIEKQDNIFSKVENNINQFAKVANANKNVSEYSMKKFLELLEEVQRLKKEQNEMVKHIYKLIANDS